MISKIHTGAENGAKKRKEVEPKVSEDDAGEEEGKREREKEGLLPDQIHSLTARPPESN